MSEIKYPEIDYSLYLVTNSTNKRDQEFLNIIEDALKGGVSLVQIREKELELVPFYEKALKVKKLTDKYNVPLIINDRVSIAIGLGTCGAHIGQEDMDVEMVRKALNENQILGVSASTVEEAIDAEKKGADYLGCGAVFPTGTKDDAPDMTKEELINIVNAVNIPVVAIGGITEDNVEEFESTGISGISVVSAIMESKNPKKSSENLKSKFESIK